LKTKIFEKTLGNIGISKMLEFDTKHRNTQIDCLQLRPPICDHIVV